MSNRERILIELQMLTGTVSNDMEYLLSLLLKDRTVGKKDSLGVSKYVETENVVVTEFKDMDVWFNSLVEVVESEQKSIN